MTFVSSYFQAGAGWSQAPADAALEVDGGLLGLFQHMMRPPQSGEPLTHSLMSDVRFVLSATPRDPDPVESEVFGDVLPAVCRTPAELEKILRWRVRYADKGSYAEAAEVARTQAWLLAREADTLMGNTKPKRALDRLTEARMALSLWRVWAGPDDVPGIDRLDSVWARREAHWESLVRDLEEAASGFQASKGSSLWRRRAKADKAMAAGRLFLGVTRALDQGGYPTFAHHVLHYGTEEALQAAERLCDSRTSQALQARSLYEEARRLHSKTHDDMYWSTEWIPILSEDGRPVIRPNVISIRAMAVSLAAYLGLGPLNPREILESVRDEDRLFPIQKAVTDLENYQRSLETLRADRTSRDDASVFAVFLGLGSVLGRARRTLVDRIGNVVPLYLDALFNGFAAAVGGLPGASLTSKEVEDRLEAVGLLLRIGQIDLAHDLARFLEDDLKSGRHPAASGLLAQARNAHDQVHRATDEALREAVAESLGPAARTVGGLATSFFSWLGVRR